MRPFILRNLNLLCNKSRITRQTRLIVNTVAKENCNKQDGSNEDAPGSKILYAATFGIAGFLTALTTYKTIDALRDNKSSAKTYSKEEVAKHDSLDRGVWITYKGNVYDITEFIKHHPGGSHTIMMGAGGDVEPFWQTYTVHQAIEVQNLLSTYKIGVLSTEDNSLNVSPDPPKTEGPYSNEPVRSALLEVLTVTPFNAETPSKLLTPYQTTPNEIFFVRNHLPVPEVDISEYSLTICRGTDGDPDNLKVIAEFTLDELKSKFESHTIESVIQCSGNRRTDLKKIKEIKGLDWKVGAIGNAKWTGVKLVDVLESIGVKSDDESIKHIQAEGLDCDMSGQSYGASISADVALDPKRDVLLAYEMNGQPLSRDHGFPLRFVAPGVTGARNVKWLSKIILSHEESHSHWQRNDYKSFSPNVDMFNLDYKQSISIQETPIQSAICEPSDGDTIKLERKRDESPVTIPIKGYAFSGGGKMVIRVDISIDGGNSWFTATLLKQPRGSEGLPDWTDRNRTWSWSRWVHELPVPDHLVKNGSGTLEVLCRAFDSSYNSQPEKPDAIWNVRGVVNNSWHKIKINVIVE